MLIDKLTPLEPELSDDDWLARHHHPRLNLEHTRGHLVAGHISTLREFHHHLEARMRPNPDLRVHALFVGIPVPPDTLLPEEPDVCALVWIDAPVTRLSANIVSEGCIEWVDAAASRHGLQYAGTLLYSTLVLPSSRINQLANLGVQAHRESKPALDINEAFLSYILPRA